MRVIAAIAVAALCTSVGVCAETSVGQTVVVAKPRKVCRTVEVTGRRIGSSVCHTADEWAAIQKEDEERTRSMLDQVDRNSRSQTGAVPGTNSALSAAGSMLPAGQ